MADQVKTLPHRLVAIDALRAIVMVLMIFVNDLWSLAGIPEWLEHAPGDANYMGLADVVFPAFLFIVGLSVPFAVDSRRKKGDSDRQIFFHIASRALALLIMGFFHVNLESYNDAALLPRPVWQMLITIAFFLIWLDHTHFRPIWGRLLRPVGAVLLLLMAICYQSAKAKGITAMEVQWWGILGLIGWAYLIASCVFLFSAGKLWLQISALLFFIAFNSASTLGWLTPLDQIHQYIWIAENGAMPTLSMAGIIVALFYRKYTSANPKFWISIAIFALLMLAFGFLTDHLWGISKIRATPSWTTICAAITTLAFGLMVLLTEKLNQRKWYEWIKPAGTSTLICYLIPYLHYALIGLFSIPQLPLILRTGNVGLLKSLVYALIIVGIAGLLSRRNIRLKI